MRSQSESQEALLVQELLSPFRERPIAVEPAEESEARVQRIVPNLEQFARQLVATRRRRSLYRRGGWLLAALSAGVGAGLLYGRIDDDTSSDGVTVSGELVQVGDREQRTVLSGSLEVSPLGRVETKTTGAEITTREGLDLVLGPLTSARIGQIGGSRPKQRVRLESGSIECKVPKLPSGSQFSVVTPDALVVVHGTRFSVEVQPDEDGAPNTCVRVTEGKVAVHGKAPEPVFLLPGQQFGCDIPTAPEKAAQAVANEPAGTPSEADQRPNVRNKRPRVALDSAKKPVVEERGTLAEETALLQAAVGAEQRGDITGARANLHELLTKYPKSPLGEDARLMLERLSSREP
jgi:hypothetical protein